MDDLGLDGSHFGNKINLTQSKHFHWSTLLVHRNHIMGGRDRERERDRLYGGGGRQRQGERGGERDRQTDRQNLLGEKKKQRYIFTSLDHRVSTFRSWHSQHVHTFTLALKRIRPKEVYNDFRGITLCLCTCSALSTKKATQHRIEII